VSAFPENDVVVIQQYLDVPSGSAAADTIGAIQTALRADQGIKIQSNFPFKPFKPINTGAVERRRARAKLDTFLQQIEPMLQVLSDLAPALARHRFGDADSLLANLPPANPAIGISVDEIQTAVAPQDIEVENFGPPANDPTSTLVTFKGYAGPRFDPQLIAAAGQIARGGPDRDLELGLLRGEVGLGKADTASLLAAIDAYTRILPPSSTLELDVFDLHLKLFQQLVTQIVPPSTLPPAQRFAAIRCAFAYVRLADQLFRRQRQLDDTQRAGISATYDAAAALLQQCGISADNPRRQELGARITLQKARLIASVNYLGLRDSFVPVQRASQLEQDAISFISTAIATATDFATLIDQIQQVTEQVMDLQFQQHQERDNLQILAIKQQNATLAVDKIDEQLKAIQDQEDALLAQSVVSGFRAIVEGAVVASTTGSAAKGVLSGAGGVVSATVNYAAQSNELEHQQQMAEIERQIAVNQVDIAGLEEAESAQRIQFYADKLASIGNQRHNLDFLYVLAELAQKRAERQVDVAVLLAYLFERALAFFLGNPFISHIQFDYIDRPGSIEDAAKALQEDFQAVLAERDAVNASKFDFFQQAISLREEYPIQFARFLETGTLDFDFTLYQLSKLRPATHQCRLREVGVEISGLIPPTGFSGTLTHRGRFLVRDRLGTLDPSVTRLIPTEDQVAQALEQQRQLGLPVAAVGGVLLYSVDSDTKELNQNTQFVSPDPPTDATLAVFEGHGPTGLWRLSIQEVGQLAITDVLLHFAIVSRASDVDELQGKVQQLVHSFEAELAGGDALERIAAVSLRQIFPDTFFALQSGTAGLTLGPENVPSNLRNLEFKQILAQALDEENKPVAGVGIEIARPDAGFDQVRVTRADGFTEDLDAAPQSLPPNQRFPLLGVWQVKLSDPSSFQSLGDLRLFFTYAFEES
jgi:hypothetical protein